VVQVRSSAVSPDKTDPNENWRLAPAAAKSAGGGAAAVTALSSSEQGKAMPGVVVTPVFFHEQKVWSMAKQAPTLTIKGLKKGKKGHPQAGFMGKYKLSTALAEGRPEYVMKGKKGLKNYLYYVPHMGMWQISNMSGAEEGCIRVCAMLRCGALGSVAVCEVSLEEVCGVGWWCGRCGGSPVTAVNAADRLLLCNVLCVVQVPSNEFIPSKIELVWEAKDAEGAFAPIPEVSFVAAAGKKKKK
jgi:hypothetical protein